MVSAQIVLSSNVVLAEESSDRLEELRRQQDELQNESSQVESNIQGSRDQINSLSEEKSALQADISIIQANVDQLIQEISQSENEIAEKEEEIERLHKEIEVLIDLIERRTEKIEDQARAVQQSGDANTFINVLLSSESFSDLLDRAKFISEIVSSNQSVIADQKRDQEALEETEEQVAFEQAALEETKQELEVSRNNLVNERLALEDRVGQVTAQYNLSEKDLNNLLGQQEQIAQKTNELNSQVEAEQERIEQERIERERREREEAERQRREEEEEDRQRQEEARLARAAAEREAQAAQASASSSSSSSSSNTVEASTPAPAPAPAPTPAPAPQSGGWIRPSGGYISSRFGYRIHPIFGTRRLHAGVDFAGSGPIRAAKGGTVTSASYSGGLGYHVRINHGNGMSSVYAHLQPGMRVAPGQIVSQGQTLGMMGSTGASTGVHLHFEIHQNGTPVNPLNYIR